MSVHRTHRDIREFAGATRRRSVNCDSRARLREGQRQIRRSYHVRFLSCLAASIGLMLAIAHLPLTGGWQSVGWYVVHPTEQVHFELIEVAESSELADGSPITELESNVEQPPPGDLPPPNQPEAELEDRIKPPNEDRVLRRFPGRKVIDSAQQMPKIIGGIGSYYIHIDYPEEAMLAGVEGRLVLSFVVETTGHTSAVEVVETLHPACDSAAVRALRRTRFMPGRQNGDIVPVRMRLPVRFKLVPRSGDELYSGAAASS